MNRNCTVYVIDTNVIVSILLGGRKTRRCIEECGAKYMIPYSVMQEILRLRSEKEFKRIVSKFKKKIIKGPPIDLIADLISRIFDLLAILLSIYPIYDKPSRDDLRIAENIIGNRDPTDIPIIAVSLNLARKYKDEVICIWTNDNDILETLPKKRTSIHAVKTPHCCK